LHSFVKSEEAPWAVEQVCNSIFVCLEYHANSVYRSGALRLSTANATTAVASSSQLKRANTSSAVWSMTTRVSRRLQRRVDDSFLYFFTMTCQASTYVTRTFNKDGHSILLL
jgi:hypothetical protein